MPDIVITPNRGTSNNPKIDFTGTSAGTIKLEVLADGSISWNGANGSLFSIADGLSGSLMSVNDISGLPAFEVFSDNRVVIGQFGAKLGIGIASPTAPLQIATTGVDEQLILGSTATNRDIAMSMYSGTTKAEVIRYQSSSNLIFGLSASVGNIQLSPGGSAKMYIKSDGNVGIGTTSPGGVLEVRAGSTSGWDRFVVTTTSLWGDGSTQYVTIGAGGASGIMLSNPHVVWSSGASAAGIRMGRSGGVSGGAYYEIGTGASDSFHIKKESTTRLYIDTNGNVGINQATPSYKLEVSGDIYANGGWFRVSGSQGYYFQDYGGGWYMTDSTWMRAYNDKAIITNNEIRGTIFRDSANTGFYIDPNGTSLLSSLAFTGDNTFAGFGTLNTYTSANTLLNSTSTIRISGTANHAGLNILNNAPYNIDYVSGDNAMPYGYSISDNRTGEHCGFMMVPQSSGGSNGDMIFYVGNDGSNKFRWKYFNWDGSNNHLTNVADKMSLDMNGVMQVAGSARAPIFYDSNDTTYFCDPNSRSRLVSIDYGNSAYYLAAGDWGYRHNTPYGWIQFGPANASYAHIYTDRSNFYFNVNDLYLNGYIVPMYGYNRGGNLYADTLYDSGNTNYFVDPAGTSRLNTIGVSNGSLLGAYLQYNGNQNNMRIQGSNGTEVGLSGYRQDGTWCFQLYGNATEYGFLNGNWAGWDIRKVPSGNLYLNGGSTYYVGTDTLYYNRVYGTADIRSPIFYDNDNTSYYVDPATGTNLNGTLVNNGGTAMSAGWNRNLLLSSTFPVIVFNSNSTKYSGIGVDYSDASSGFRFWVNGSSADISGTGTAAMTINTGNYVQAGGSFRAPIFYDSNNTNYYIDPDNVGTAIFAAGSVRGSYYVASNYSTTGYTQYKGYDNNNHFILIRGSVGGNTTTPTLTGGHQTTLVEYAETNDSTGWFFRTSATGNYDIVSRITRSYSAFEGSVRGPLFYDTDDTNYYLNPASAGSPSSVLRGRIDIPGTHNYSSLRVYLPAAQNGAANGTIALQMWCSEPGNTWDGAGFGYNVDNNENNGGAAPAYYFGRINTSLGQSYMRFLSNGDWYFYNTNTSGTRTLSLGVGNDGIFYVYNQIRTPIVYDYNNTSYYVDPASTSYLNLVRCNNWLYLDQNYGHSIVGLYASTRYQGIFAMGDSYKLPADGTSTGSLYGVAWSHPNAGGVAANLNTHGMLVMENGTFLAAVSGSIRCRDNMQAPVYYDKDNTAYYFDGASNSVANRVQIVSLGVGTPESGTTGEIRATNNITAYYSDERLKTRLGTIENPIEKIKSLSGFYFEANETAVALGYEKKREVGVSAQEVQAVLPEIIAPAPIDDKYLTVRYEKLIPLLIEAIKDQQKQIEQLSNELKSLKNKL